MNQSARTLYTSEQLNITIERLSYQLAENHYPFDNTVFIGLQPRGVYLAERIVNTLKKQFPDTEIHHGELDITFYRDDFNTTGSDALPVAKATIVPTSLTKKRVVLIDDVFFTGRTIRAGLDALLDHGRPSEIELLVLIDRRFNREVPIHADYIGMTVDAVDAQKVRVQWADEHHNDEVVLIERKK